MLKQDRSSAMSSRDDNLFRKVQEEVSKLPNKLAFDFACQVSPGLVYEADFVKHFLNAEGFDPKATAKRLVDHFAHKYELFGTEGLSKPMALSDYTPEDRSILTSNVFELVTSKVNDGMTCLLVVNCWRIAQVPNISKQSMVRK